MKFAKMKTVTKTNTTNDLTTALVSFLDEKLRAEHPTQLPPTETADAKSLKWLAPIAVQAGFEVRKNRVLEAFARLPHADFIRDIENTRDILAAALEKYRAVEADLRTLRDKENTLHQGEALRDEDIKNATDIQGRERWLKNAAVLHERYGELEAVLLRVSGQLRDALELFYPIGALLGTAPFVWRQAIGHTAEIPLADPAKGAVARGLPGQCDELLKIAAKALDAIRALQNGNVVGLANGNPQVREIKVRFAELPVQA
jgi:hypothetical protein